MGQTIGLILLLSPIALPLGLGIIWILGTAVRAYARSRYAWIASGLLLPHYASKLWDRIAAAFGAGNIQEAALFTVPLVLIIVAIKLLIDQAGKGKNDDQPKTPK